MALDRFGLRRADLGDELVVRAVRLQALSDTPDAFGSTYEREVTRTVADWKKWLSGGAIFILDHPDGANGMVAGVRDATDPTRVHLMAMWVHPALRGSGAADALVSAVVAWAGEEGARRVELAVIQTNDRARRFYERLGFRDTGRRTVRERDGMIELRMDRPVRAPVQG